MFDVERASLIRCPFFVVYLFSVFCLTLSVFRYGFAVLVWVFFSEPRTPEFTLFLILITQYLILTTHQV